MRIRGTIPVTFFATCGWQEETTIWYDVECEPTDSVRDAIERKYDGLAEQWHEQSGCEYNCGCFESFDWDREERRE